MKDLSAYYEIARLITAELSETITPEEKERLNVWLAEDERHYMRYCRIRERLKRGEGENVFRNPERVREDMEKLKKKFYEFSKNYALGFKMKNGRIPTEEEMVIYSTLIKGYEDAYESINATTLVNEDKYDSVEALIKSKE